MEKLNAGDYSTSMVGVRFKLAHRRAGKDKWSITDPVKRKNLVKILKDMIAETEKEPEKALTVLLEFEYKGKEYKGMGVPVISSCERGVCQQLDIMLSNTSIPV